MVLSFRAVAGCVLLTALLCSAPARGHEFHPGVLVLRELGEGRFAVRWSPPPSLRRLSAGEALRFPDHCARKQGFLLDCGARGLVGALEVRAPDRDLLRVHLTVHTKDGGSTTRVVRSGVPIELYMAPEGASAVTWTKIAADYVAVGFEHILAGADHLLFVLGLVLLVGIGPRLFWTVTAFTLAHSIALAGSTLGAWALPSAPVETVIALSVLLVAHEATEAESSWTRRKPWAIAFLFGLLHGLGFAGALGELGLPPHHAAWALVSFNVGVELGQLAFIAAVAAAGRVLIHSPRVFQGARWAALYAMGSYAAYLCLLRFAVIIR